MRFDKLGPRGETDPDDLIAKAGRLAASSPECAEAIAVYRPWVERGAAALPDDCFAALPACLVHGDVQPGNVLFDEGGVAAFVDLDWCAWRPRIYDLAFAIAFCCAVHETPIDGGDVWSLTQPLQVERALRERLIEAYESRAPALGEAERCALPAQVALSWRHSRISGALKVSEDERAAFLARPPHTLGPVLGGMAGP